VPVAPSGSPLTLGIYPGGGAGMVFGPNRHRAEDPAQRLDALVRLAGGRPFVAHLYQRFSGDPRADAHAPAIDEQVAKYAAAGIRSELVLTYRPAVGTADPVAGFEAFVREVVRHVAAHGRVVALQITNEANVAGQPETSDGAYPDVAGALTGGVIAAKDEATRLGAGHLAVGFNWAYGGDVAAEGAFWRGLAQRGGPRFADAVDWVGLDVYPLTWTPLPDGLTGAFGVRAAMHEALDVLRRCHMPAAGLGPRVAIHVSETGYPTGPGRGEATQAAVLRAAVGAVSALRTAYGVTDLRWFDLRDADSSGGFESQYGLLRDDGSPKAAFAVLQGLVRHGAAARCAATRSVILRLPRAAVRRMHALTVSTRAGRVLRRLRARSLPVRLRVRLPAATRGRGRLHVRLTGRAQARRSLLVGYAACAAARR
jgi:hypothetical protein